MQLSQIRQMLNKVPEVTIYFWIIKVLCTTVGETAADYLNETLHFGLTGTSLVMGVLLLIVLGFQFKARKYNPAVYWLAVVILSIVGTLITDNLTDKLGVSLVTTTVIFSIALVLTFAVWYMVEKTLSVHKANGGFLVIPVLVGKVSILDISAELPPDLAGNIGQPT